MLREIKSHQRLIRQLFFSVDGSAVAGGTLTKNGLLVGKYEGLITENSAGNYTITFNQGGSRILNVQITPITDVTTCRVIAATTTTVQIEQVGADQTTPVADSDFFVTVTLSDSADEN
jgi:hypothetical protein